MNDMKQYVRPFILLLIPITGVFDLITYVIQRPSCLNCGSIIDYFHKKGLTSQIIHTALAIALPDKEVIQFMHDSGTNNQ